MDLINDKNVRKEIENLLTAGFSEGSFGGSSGNDLKFQFAWPPTVLVEKDYQNPWTASNPTGFMSATENISSLVNPIPYLQDVYAPSANTVESVYGDLILNATAVNPGQSLVSRGDPETTTFNLGTQKESNPLNIAIETDSAFIHQTMEQERAVSVDIASQVIAARIAGKNAHERTGAIRVIKDKLPPNKWLKQYNPAYFNYLLSNVQQIKTLPNAVNPTENLKIAQPDTAGERGLTSEGPVPLIVKMLYNANQLFESTAVSNLDNPRISYHPSYINPNNFATPESAQEWPFFKTVIQDTNNNPVTIRMNYTRADIVRPWFTEYLLSMDGWKLQGQTAGWLSSGDPVSNRGLFPLLPVSVILCRNLQITNDNTSYIVAGLQIIAWCCKVTPKMAPQ